MRGRAARCTASRRAASRRGAARTCARSRGASRITTRGRRELQRCLPWPLPVQLHPWRVVGGWGDPSPRRARSRPGGPGVPPRTTGSGHGRSAARAVSVSPKTLPAATSCSPEAGPSPSGPCAAARSPRRAGPRPPRRARSAARAPRRARSRACGARRSGLWAPDGGRPDAPPAGRLPALAVQARGDLARIRIGILLGLPRCDGRALRWCCSSALAARSRALSASWRCASAAAAPASALFVGLGASPPPPRGGSRVPVSCVSRTGARVPPPANESTASRINAAASAWTDMVTPVSIPDSFLVLDRLPGLNTRHLLLR